MINRELGFILLFVNSPVKSAEFYSMLLGREPVELSPTFAMFVLADGSKIGLWSAHTAEPTVSAKPGATEICFSADDVDAVYEKWGMQGITMIQKPTYMDFGYTFVAIDPDGHRIRVYKLHEEK